MHASQWKTGCGVIELAVGPLHGVVALLAGGGKARVWHGRGRTRKIFLMAGEASGSGEVVIVVDVAIDALPRRNGVSAG